MSSHLEENTIGALLFYGYILSALFLTGLICRDLAGEYFATCKDRQVQPRPQKRIALPRTEKQIQISTLAALSFLSFSVLSYHMLNFLIHSYQTWTILSPQRALSATSVRTWSTQSRLFREFGEVICNDPRRFWWTRLALTYSLGWNVYMTTEGK